MMRAMPTIYSEIPNLPHSYVPAVVLDPNLTSYFFGVGVFVSAYWHGIAGFVLTVSAYCRLFRLHPKHGLFDFVLARRTRMGW